MENKIPGTPPRWHWLTFTTFNKFLIGPHLHLLDTCIPVTQPMDNHRRPTDCSRSTDIVEVCTYGGVFELSSYMCNWLQHYSRHSSWKKKTQKGHSSSTAELCSPSAWWLPHNLHEHQFLWNLLTSPLQNYAWVAPISAKSSLLRLKSSMSDLGLILFQTFKLDWFNCFWARGEEKKIHCLVQKNSFPLPSSNILVCNPDTNTEGRNFYKSSCMEIELNTILENCLPVFLFGNNQGI